jgi:hypothetical protein
MEDTLARLMRLLKKEDEFVILLSEIILTLS